VSSRGIERDEPWSVSFPQYQKQSGSGAAPGDKVLLWMRLDETMPEVLAVTGRNIGHNIGQIGLLTRETVNDYKALNALKDRPKS
jgi:hypothetical protein